jgi:hypothetical protein
MIVFLMLLISACSKSDDLLPLLPSSGGDRIMFFSSNHGDHSIRITDDINSLADGATATPRIITGSNVPMTNPQGDSLVVDRRRKMVYVSDDTTNNIIVYHHALTATGNIPPDRTITINTLTYIRGIALDYTRDRLYVAGDSAGGSGIFILNNASTLSGAKSADVFVHGSTYTGILFIDSQNDRLYVTFFNGVVWVFDNASTLTTGSTPARTITMSDGLQVYSMWADAGTDRLYLGRRDASSGGYNLFIFDGASTLSGTYNPDTNSTAQIALGFLVNAMVDNQDHLYMWSDSAISVLIYNNASTLAGNATASPHKTINAVVDIGYGMDILCNHFYIRLFFENSGVK